MASLLGLLIAISIFMIVVSHISFPSQFDTIQGSSTQMLDNLSLSDSSSSRNASDVSDSDGKNNWFSTASERGIVQGATLGVLAGMYLLLLILMTRTSLSEVYLIIFSYIILASFFGIEVCYNHWKRVTRNSF